MTIRVFIVDDQAIVRTGLRMILSAELDIEVVGEVAGCDAALPLIRKLVDDFAYEYAGRESRISFRKRTGD